MFTANALPVLQKWGVEEKMVYDVFQRILSLQKISSNFEAIFKDKQSFLREKEMLTLKKKRREKERGFALPSFLSPPFCYLLGDLVKHFCGAARKLGMKLPCFSSQCEQS